MMKAKEIWDIEVDLLLDAIFRRYGYDFRHYARASLKRRLALRLEAAGLSNLSEMIPRVIHDEAFFNELLMDLSITVTEMFREPHFYRALRETVIPVLKTYPFVKIWHAGCATGEEVYSMAILLKEEGFYDRVQIYATDFNNHSLAIAREGIYKIDEIRKFADNYNKSGRKGSFSDYFQSDYNAGRLRGFLKKNVLFSHHNLVTDGSFGEMNLIVCRNVMIYFDKTLQNRVLSLFWESLAHGGFLCLGAKETLDFTDFSERFVTVSQTGKIYKKTVNGKR